MEVRRSRDQSPTAIRAPGASPGEPAGSPSRGARAASIVSAVSVLLVAALLVLFGLALARRQEPGGGGFGINSVGTAATLKARPAPDFLVDSFDGGSVRLSELRGQTVILNFWASWCPPCREEARILSAAADAYADRGVTFLGVNVWDADGDARAFLERYGVRYPNGPDDAGRITIDYGVTGLPETFLITRDGTLVKKWVGPFTETQLERFIREALQ